MSLFFFFFLPVSVVDHRVDDGVHLLGELGRVGGQFLRRRASTPLLGLAAAAAAVVPARRVFVLTSLAFALLQPDLLLHLLQVPVLDGLEGGSSHRLGLDLLLNIILYCRH